MESRCPVVNDGNDIDVNDNGANGPNVATGPEKDASGPGSPRSPSGTQARNQAGQVYLNLTEHV
jgi:hypothetical protein